MTFFEQFNEQSAETLKRELEPSIKGLIGAHHLKIKTVQVTQDKRYAYPKRDLVIESNDLGPTMSPRLFKELKVDSVHGREDGDQYRFTLHYSWVHYSGGYNGTRLADVCINPDGTLETFEPVRGY